MDAPDVPFRRVKFAARVTSPVALVLICAAAGLLVACGASPVQLGAVRYPAAPVLEYHGPTATVPRHACPGSLRTAQSGRDIYGAWWQVRDDSSSVLMVGRSTNQGKSWVLEQPADTADRSLRGCTRPAPAVASDSTTNYVDIAYYLEPSEGPGVFFTHSMDARHLGTGEGIFHSPVAVTYGDHPSDVSVASNGDTLVVAFEDPNGDRSSIGLALSYTMGHIFEQRVDISPPDIPARAPIVALLGDSVLVQWYERPDSVPTGGRVAVRSVKW